VVTIQGLVHEDSARESAIATSAQKGVRFIFSQKGVIEKGVRFIFLRNLRERLIQAPCGDLHPFGAPADSCICVSKSLLKSSE
jgi:hypothetical protein